MTSMFQMTRKLAGFRWARIGACAASLCSLVSCSYFLGSKADSEQPFKKSSDTACVKDVGANMKAWFEEGAGDIGASVDCAVLAIDEFTGHVVGQTNGMYTRAELANFFKTYLAEAGSPLANDADAWTHEAMTLKQLAFGGGTGSVTKDEVARIRAFLLRAKPVLASVTPAIKIMFFKTKKALPEESANAAQAIDRVTKFIAEEFSASVSERPTTSAEAVLASARRLGVDSSRLDDWVPIASAIKAIVVGGERDRIRAEEWTPMLEAAGRAWALSVQYNYEVYHNEEWLGENFASTERVMFGFLDLLETGVRNHKRGIPLADWEACIAAVGEKGFLPEGMTAQTISRLLPTIFGKLLYGNSKQDRVSKSVVFGPDQFTTLKNALKDLTLGQRLIIASFGGAEQMTHSSLLRELSSDAVILNADVAALDRTFAVKVRNALHEFYSEGRPLSHMTMPPKCADVSKPECAGSHALMVVPRSETPALTRYDLDKLNVIRVLVTTVLRGWAHDAKAANDVSGLLEEEAQEVYLDVKDFGAELGFMDVRNNAAGIRTFMEGGIFTSVSDGSSRMSVREAVEWFHFVMGGGGLADDMHRAMLKEGCGLTTRDVLGELQLQTSCFRERFLFHFGESFPNMPHMTRWVKADRSGGRASRLLLALEDAGRTRGALDNEPVEATELRSMIPILHYAESIFARHDKDRDDILDDDELDGAFPIMAPFIKKMGNGKADGPKMQKAIYAYLLKYGEPPQPKLMDGLKLLKQRFFGGKKSADRLKVLGVMASFGKASKQARMRDIEKFLKDNKGHVRSTLAERAVDKKLAELFQCHEDASGFVGETFARLSSYVTQDGEGVDAFVARGQLAIASDKRLTMKCLPF